MNLTHCPVCKTRVHQTHRCQGRPVDLVPMPTDFRSLVDQARVHGDAPYDSVEQLRLNCPVCGSGEVGDCVCPR